MRLPRSNFLKPGNMTGEADSPETEAVQGPVAAPRVAPPQRRSTDEMAAREIEGRNEMPVWQNAFALAPNVRFTRTPETAISRRLPVEPPLAGALPAAEPQPELVGPAAALPGSEPPAVTAPLPRPAPSMAAPVADTVLPAHLAQSQPTGARAITWRLRQAFEKPAAAAPVVTPAPVAAPVVAPVSAGSAAAVRGLPAAAYLSDFAFFEGLDLPPVSASVPVSAVAVDTTPAERPVAAPVTEPAPAVAPVAPVPSALASAPTPDNDAALRLYRSIAVRAGTPLEAPVAVPEAPVAVAEAVPVVAAPVAPAPAAPPVLAPRALPTGLVFTEIEGEYVFPPLELLQEPQVIETAAMTPEALEQSAGLLESVLEDFGVKGEIIDVRPGPVVTLYEFEPAPGVKSSRVIGLSDDIARSMSALSARVAVVPGRNVIGIELPNPVRETVYFRELIESRDYTESRFQLPVCLGKTIGGEPVVAELAKMPHLLVAGTTGSGKSVAINTMILSLLYRLKPEECRLIMVDPKMLELSVYDGIPHLLTPVVTDPKKAVMALKWAVREMEERYKKMSRLGVRNIDGYNTRAATARSRGETILATVQTGFDRSTGEPVYEQEEMDLSPMPYIVVIVDEMADLMMVAGKEIEGAIQRLAQMARAAGIHLIMATQRPSVDVITGTIKANFPTRISFQVTSKIDSRTILGEPGAEHLLGQGDMLHMVGGGRIARVHGPFVSDLEVEKVVAHLKTQGRPDYLGTVTEDADAGEEPAEDEAAVFDKTAMGEEDASDLYEKAVKVVMRDRKCSTSYIQRRLSIGYNRAASLVERMEQDGLVGPPNHVGKRAIIAGGRDAPEVPGADIEL